MSVVLDTLIQNHFNDYQKQSRISQHRPKHNHHQSHHHGSSATTNSQSFKIQTEKLRKDLIENFIALQASNLSLNDNGQDHDIPANYQKEVSKAVISIIKSVLSTIVSLKLTTQNSFSKSEHYDSSMSIMEYIAYFICNNFHSDSSNGTGTEIGSSSSLLDDSLQFILKFTSISNFESIRCLLCSFIGWCSTFLLEQQLELNHQHHRGRGLLRTGSGPNSKKQMTNESLLFLSGCESHLDHENRQLKFNYAAFMVTNVFVKRLLDKNQAVRSVAIISSCSLLSSILELVKDCIQRKDVTEGSDNHHYNDHLVDGDKIEHEEEKIINILIELINALEWNMVHDPSYVNRSAVLQSLPIEKLTTTAIFSEGVTTKLMAKLNDLKMNLIETIVERVRDDKVKVRIDALNALRKVNVENDLTIELRCEILRHGLSTRYPATLTAATKMLCCGWMKTMKFNPVATLALFDPTQNESIAENVARAIICAAGVVGSDYKDSPTDKNCNHNASTITGELATTANKTTQYSSEVTLMDLSDAEIREFKKNIMNYESLNRDESDGSTHDALNPAAILYLRVMCEMVSSSKTLTEVKKTNLISHIVSDVTLLSEVLERHMQKLNDIRMNISESDDGMESDDEVMMEDHPTKEDNECFVCLHLLKLATVIDLKEEGSRRHLSSIIHRILCSPSTHEELIENCVHVLSASNDSEASFLQSISEVLVSTIESVDETNSHSEEKQIQYLRAIEILSVTLEKTSRQMSKNPILHNFSNIILTTITDSSLGPIVREAGVSCLGRYVVLMDEDVIIEKYKPLMMEIAFMEGEKIEIRAQALLAMCDLAQLYERFMSPISLDCSSDGDAVNFSDVLLRAMAKSKKSLQIVSAEVAAKLMFFGRLHDAKILSHLMTIYFDQTFCSSNIDENSDDVKEVGSPTRLQQLLTIFFPAYVMKSCIGRDTVLASVPVLLELVNDKMNARVKGKKSTSYPITKMFDYILHLVEKRQDTDVERQSTQEPSPMLIISLAISNHILENGHQLSTSYTRSLCKILNKSYVDVTSEEQSSLRRFKNSIDELSMHITDDSALRSLEPLIILLEDVQSDIESVGNDESQTNTSKMTLSMNENEGNHTIDSSTKKNSTWTSDKDVDVESIGGSNSSSSISDDESSHENLQEASDIADIAAAVEKINVASSLSKEPEQEENLPVFATVGKSMQIKEISSKSSRVSEDDDIPLFATLGEKGKNHRSRKRIVIESSESESEEDNFSSSGDECSSSSDEDDDFSD